MENRSMPSDKDSKNNNANGDTGSKHIYTIDHIC